MYRSALDIKAKAFGNQISTASDPKQTGHKLFARVKLCN